MNKTHKNFILSVALTLAIFLFAYCIKYIPTPVNGTEENYVVLYKGQPYTASFKQSKSSSYSRWIFYVYLGTDPTRGSSSGLIMITIHETGAEAATVYAGDTFYLGTTEYKVVVVKSSYVRLEAK